VIKHERSGAASSRSRQDVSTVIPPLGLGIPTLGLRSVLRLLQPIRPLRLQEFRSAYSEGYHDGLKTGQGDAKHRRSYDPQRSHYFQEAGFGNFGEVYRSGFVRGYADGFRS